MRSASPASVRLLVLGVALATSTTAAAVGARPLSDVFVPMLPCRIADTRAGSGFTGSYGPPSLAANATRSMYVATNPTCSGIPNGTLVSFNFTVTNTQGDGAIRVYETGTSAAVPVLSYAAGQTVSNTAFVPIGPNYFFPTPGITIKVDGAGTDLLVDVNGYFIGYGATLPTNQGLWLTGDSGPVLAGTVTGSQAGSSAVSALSLATSGVNSALRGENRSLSANSAAILGISDGTVGATLNFAHTAIRGESATGNGILGMTRGGFGVRGDSVNSSGTLVTSGILGGWAGVIFTGGLAGSGTKSFVEPHPVDASKEIRYVALEGPEAGTYFRGTARTVHGVAIIEVPETFRMVTGETGLTAQVTSLGRPTAMAVSTLSLDRIVVESEKDVTFSYLVQGIRRAYPDFAVVRENVLFRPASPEARLPEGLSPDERQRLIDNGTYNPDGSVNTETAERLGWTREWEGRK